MHARSTSFITSKFMLNCHVMLLCRIGGVRVSNNSKFYLGSLYHFYFCMRMIENEAQAQIWRKGMQRDASFSWMIFETFPPWSECCCSLSRASWWRAGGSVRGRWASRTSWRCGCAGDVRLWVGFLIPVLLWRTWDWDCFLNFLKNTSYVKQLLNCVLQSGD